MGKRAKTTDSRITFHFEFLTEGQREAWRAMSGSRVTFLTGPAGTAKTFLAVAYAAKSAVEWRVTNDILLLRPTVEAAGERIGYLPGPIAGKVKPFLSPAFSIIEKLSRDNDALKSALASRIRTDAIAYIRGTTFENTVVVVDEAQNVNLRQMRLIVSRLGPNSKIIFCGDTDQIDTPDGCLERAARSMSHRAEIGHYEFTAEDNVRDPLINGMLDDLRNC